MPQRRTATSSRQSRFLRFAAWRHRCGSVRPGQTPNAKHIYTGGGVASADGPGAGGAELNAAVSASADADMSFTADAIMGAADGPSRRNAAPSSFAAVAVGERWRSADGGTRSASRALTVGPDVCTRLRICRPPSQSPPNIVYAHSSGASTLEWRRAAPRLVVDGRRLLGRRRSPGTASGVGRNAVRLLSDQRMTIYRDGNLMAQRGARAPRPRTHPEDAQSPPSTPTAAVNGTAIFYADPAPPPASSEINSGGTAAIGTQRCRFRCRWRSTRFGGWKALALRRPARARCRMGVSSNTRAKIADGSRRTEDLLPWHSPYADAGIAPAPLQ